jgi:hypothetical protein
MTAVARLTVSGHPLLFADLLITGKAPQRRVILPTVEVKNGPRVIQGPKSLCQKIALVGDNIVVGWAGEHKEAASVIGELKFRCENEQFNLFQVKEYLQRQRKSKIQLAGFVLDNEKNKLTSFHFGCPTFQSPVFGEIALLGSGAALLREYFQKDTSAPFCPQDQANLAIQAVGYGMAASGNFFSMEQFACENLDNGFGGGYEIATLSTDKFVKLSDVLYAFWLATLDPERKLLTLKAFPFLLFRYEYYNELLIIRGIALHENDGTAKVEETIFPIPPVDRFLTAEEKTRPPVPQLNARWICNYVQIFSEPNKMDILTEVGHATKPAWIQFEEYDGRVAKVTVSQRLYDKIIAGIEEQLSLPEKGVIRTEN